MAKVEVASSGAQPLRRLSVMLPTVSEDRYEDDRKRYWRMAPTSLSIDCDGLLNATIHCRRVMRYRPLYLVHHTRAGY
jgi:hypothetical protein